MQKTIITLRLCATLPAFLLGFAAVGQTPVPQRTRAEESAPVASGTASISGQILSDKGIPLPGTPVVAVNLTTGIQRTVSADAEGNYALNDLPPGGPYIVQVRREGFLSMSVTNVFLGAGNNTALPLTLTTEVVAVGTRRADRNALESVAPVDVVEMPAQAQQAPYTDVTQLLNYTVPSFNATRQTNAGGADFVELGSLRGLGTDQVLVLVNGKRRHTTALLGLLGNRGVGTVGTDLNTLPSNGLERVEILRDGAAAQYGSDAIAGVMNIALKSNNHGGSVLASSGLTSYGDGFSSLLSVNKGLKLGEKGFLNLTAGADYRDPIERGYARNATTSPVFSSNPAQEADSLKAFGKTYDDYRQRNGDARTYNVRGLLNASIVASDHLKFYTFGGYNYRRGQSAAPWVLPATQSDNVVRAIYPTGYQPLINARIHDVSGAAGVVLDRNGYSLDLSHTVGYNLMRYDLEHTLNPSQGATSATAFEAGGYQFLQNVTNATLNHLYDKVLAGVNVAVGGELRFDRYEIMVGDQASYGKFDTNSAGAGGSQGFTGFSLESAVIGTRRNVGGFVDVEADVTKAWTVNAALRYENYSDFGSAFIYKAATRYQLGRPLAVRAAFNTGFRAPSLQQVQYQQVTSDAGIQSGIFGNKSELAEAAGIQLLKPEKSRNYSGGLVLTPAPGLTFTADVYRIDIDDRISLTGLLGKNVNTAFTEVLNTKSVSQARFFANGVDTRTQGLDLVARYQHALGRGTFTGSVAANFTRTTVQQIHVPDGFKQFETDDDPTNNYVDQRQLSLLETGSPRSKILLHLGYEVGKFSTVLRNTYYGQVSYYDTNTDPNNTLGSYFLVFKPRVVTDLFVTYSPAKPLAITLGVNNLFNVLPSTINEAASNGRLPAGFATQADFDNALQSHTPRIRAQPEGRDIYPYAPVQMGFSGTFAYLKVAYNFGL